MPLDTSAMGAVLKVRYLGQLRKTLNNATVFLSKLEKKVQKLTGKNFTIALHVGRTNSAAIGLPEYGTLPAADRQEYADCIVPNKYIYSTLEISGQAIAAARDSVGSFVEGLESEVDGLQRDTKRAMNRIIHSTGVDVLATVQANISGASTGFVHDGKGNPFVHLPSKRIPVDIIDFTNLATIKVTATWALLGAKDAANGRFAITFFASATGAAQNVTCVAGDLIVPTGNLVGGVAQTPMGIGGIIGDTDPNGVPLQGLAVSGRPWWMAQIFRNPSAPGTLRQIDLADIQEVIDTIATQTDYSESDINLMMSNYPVRRAYFKMMIAERRQVNTMKLDGGWTALDYNGMPFVVDSQAQRNGIQFIVLDTMGIVRTADFDWMDKDGSYLYRVPTKDAYAATLFHYGNLACYNRNGNGALLDLLEA
jgi:hypothetical protein